MSLAIRTLHAGDEAPLEAFLARHADTSMFLRSNLRAAGLVDRGEPYQGTYVGAFAGDSLVAVAMHAWNGMVMVQAPDARALADVVQAAVARSGRGVVGLSGPHRQVVDARRALGLAEVAASMDARDDLYRLELDCLRVPSALERGEVRCLPPREEHRETISAWRADYCVEALGDRDGPELRARCQADIARLMREGVCFVLLDERDALVAFTGFNARLPDCVQIGGVFTPRPLRGRGHARAAVAGSLLVARAAGVTRSILFTSESNAAAARAYRALGYEIVGDYGLVRFPEPVRVVPGDGRFEP